MNPVSAYIGIGSNLENPVAQVYRAFRELQNIAHTRCTARSPLYRSDPVGPPGQPDYINAVAGLETELDPDALLAELRAIENAHGRMRRIRWGPRTLDLDILLYGDQVQSSSRLTLPHPRMHERAFVLYPLYDIAPDLHIPNKGTLADLWAACPAEGIQRLDDADA